MAIEDTVSPTLVNESSALRIVTDPQALEKHRIQHEKYVREGSLLV
jgi:hypothetical protein